MWCVPFVHVYSIDSIGSLSESDETSPLSCNRKMILLHAFAVDDMTLSRLGRCSGFPDDPLFNIP